MKHQQKGHRLLKFRIFFDEQPSDKNLLLQKIGPGYIQVLLWLLKIQVIKKLFSRLHDETVINYRLESDFCWFFYF